ncbi:MAG: extracellular solute-binding protein [Clostridia bacterium]|nr:extracellular solute-binding protein [Clostridia bacterium]
MKNKWLLIAVLVLLVTSFVHADATTEVVIWHTFTGDQDATLNALAEEFNALREDVVITVQSQPYQGFLDNVYSAVANGVGPNIIFDYASTAADYVNDGFIADIGKYIDDPDIGIPTFRDSLNPKIYLEATGFVDGKQHAIPLVTTGPILFYNKTIYDELGLQVPATWTELAANSQAIFDAKGIAGFAADSLTDVAQALIMQAGSEYIDLETLTVLWNNEAAAERLQWYADQVAAGGFSVTKTGDYWSNDFNAGLVASYIGSCAGIPYIVPDGFEFDVAPMPIEGEPWYNAWNRGILIFSADEATERAAYEFAKFYVTPENNERWCKAMISLSPYAETAARESFQAFVAVNPALAAVEANLPYAGFLPSVTGSYAVRVELGKALTLAAGGMNAAEALADAAAAANDAMQGR